MTTTDFMTAVGELLTSLEPHARIQYCGLVGGIVRIEAIVQSPESRTLTNTADARRALYDGAEKLIAVAEQVWDHERHPRIEIDGDSSLPLARAHVILELQRRP